MKTLLLALGNPILSDDAIGWEVADRVYPSMTDTELMKECTATMDLVPIVDGYGRLIIVDAIQTGNAEYGTVHRYSLEDFMSTLHYTCPHDINFITAFDLGKKMGYDIPENIIIYGIEVKELTTFGEGLSPEVAEKLDSAVEFVKKDLGLK